MVEVGQNWNLIDRLPTFSLTEMVWSSVSLVFGPPNDREDGAVVLQFWSAKAQLFLLLIRFEDSPKLQSSNSWAICFGPETKTRKRQWSNSYSTSNRLKCCQFPSHINTLPLAQHWHIRFGLSNRNCKALVYSNAFPSNKKEIPIFSTSV